MLKREMFALKRVDVIPYDRGLKQVLRWPRTGPANMICTASKSLPNVQINSKNETTLLVQFKDVFFVPLLLKM